MERGRKIVHGISPGGDFFQAIALSAQKLQLVDETVPYRWSGLLGDLAQLQAAHDLVDCIMQYDFVIIVAHSHGATVGILASQIIGQKFSGKKVLVKIKKFYALGVPVDRNEVCYPDMNVVRHFYNLFSYGDLIQRVHGVYQRTFAQHDRVVNISVQLNDLHPSHGQLHDVAVGKSLLKIPEYFQEHGFGGFQNFTYDHPATICFFSKKIPTYAFELDQPAQLELDIRAYEMMEKAFFRKQQNSDEPPF